jgi:protein-S-isoprenylcysteine O-methyltransferase Ste14
MNARLRSMLATLVLVAAAVLLVYQHSIIARTPIGIALQVLALLLMLWARVTFGMRSFHAAANPTEGGLVTSGPYRYWRHPIYAAILLFVWAAVLGQGVRPATYLLLLAALATVMTCVRIQAEEELLRAAMPEYAAYAMRTKRLVPFLF